MLYRCVLTNFTELFVHVALSFFWICYCFECVSAWHSSWVIHHNTQRCTMMKTREGLQSHQLERLASQSPSQKIQPTQKQSTQSLIEKVASSCVFFVYLATSIPSGGTSTVTQRFVIFELLFGAKQLNASIRFLLVLDGKSQRCWNWSTRSPFWFSTNRMLFVMILWHDEVWKSFHFLR